MMSFSMISLEMTNLISSSLFFDIKYIGDNMKKILLSDYKEEMGTFIDINKEDHMMFKNSLHIPYERLLINHKELLDKEKPYFIYCSGGIRSKKAVNILDFYGYDVTMVYKD